MKWLRTSKIIRKCLTAFMDAILLCVTLYLSYILRFERFYGEFYFKTTLAHLPEILAAYLLAYAFGGVYDVLWRYAGGAEILRLGIASGAACTVLVALVTFAGWNISRGMLIIHAVLSLGAVGGVRLLARMVHKSPRVQDALRHRTTVPGPRLMIVGADSAGVYMLNMCLDDPSVGQPLLFVDDDPQKQRLRLHGVSVRGRLKDIPELAARYQIQDIVIAMPELKGAALNELAETCRSTGCHVRILMRMQSSGGEEPGMYVRELNISDFLSREEIVLDTTGISDYLKDRCVLVTGGGGSIGSELCRQIMRFSPRLLLIFDIYENCAYELECELKQKYGEDVPVKILIGSVRDRDRLEEIFSEYQPETVFHAAAHKHVPLMETSPAEAVKNNIFGTLNVLETAGRHHAERFVLLSTDKAVNPTNIMGATKRVTEMMMQNYAQRTEMKCIATRFGNVLGSHGSVIPLFERQIKEGGPVRVTHPDIERYFMTIPEAAQLVLQAGAIARSGSVCVLDMGEPVKIDSLARQLIRFYGYEPGVNMEIVYTGLRPGEKLYEELLTEKERSEMERTAHKKIMIAPTAVPDAETFDRQLERLREAANANDEHVAEVLSEIVPGCRFGSDGKAE